MKKIILHISYFLFLISNTAFAASYPASCPKEAKAIVDAVGGCSSINKNLYSAVYEKCCAIKPIPPATSAPVVTPPAAAPVKIPSVAPPKKLKPLEYSLPFKNWSYSATSTPAPKTVPAPEKPQSVFNRILRFFRFR